MKFPLTIHLLIKNNESTIEKCLESISSLNAQILVGDLSCKDQTIEKCKPFGVKVVKLSLNDDLSQARNYMLKTTDSKWNLYLEPWEVLINAKEIESLLSGVNAYKANIVQGDIITKQIRLWHKDTNLKFKNPVFETIEGEAQDTNLCFISGNNNSTLSGELLKKWREKCPLKTEPIYYTAFDNLTNKNWDGFLNYSKLYLHQEKTNQMSMYMTHYYCSMVYCYIKYDYKSALESILPCIAKKPTMAEFWCLLADIYYATKDYEKAKSFYENAIILGGKRLRSDEWPLEVSKYKDYPQKMIDSCEKIKQSSHVYTNRHHFA